MVMWPSTYGKKAADMLSALFLLLALLLAGGYGPLTAQMPSIPLAGTTSSTDSGTGGHRSAPAISKQQLLVVEARDSKAAPWDDGRPKHSLVAKGIELPLAADGVSHAQQLAHFIVVHAASPFDARAPPFLS